MEKQTVTTASSVKKRDAKMEVCEQTCIHQEVVQKVQKSMLTHENIFEMADLFKVLGDPTRTKILFALFESEMCVCDLAYLLSMTQSSISHQLRVLKQAKLVKNRKEGKIVYYSLADDHVFRIFDQTSQHVKEN